MTPNEYFKNVCGIKLEPCPFCGGEAEVTPTSVLGTPWGNLCCSSTGYAVSCKNCGAAIASYIDLTKAEEQWNKRAN